ncbi:MAG: histidine phosphatase family protein [Eubacteriales bacterium]|nr:histidine phosphatase family protein [Eubacteriales bacterium]
MKIYVVRHGETNWNIEKKLQGRADIPLNAKGKKLAEVTGEALSDIPFDLCFASPLIRTIQTADGLLKHNQGFCERVKAMIKNVEGKDIFRRENLITSESGLPIIKEDRLIEICFGCWEGLSTDKDNFEIPVDDFSSFFANPELVKLPCDAEKPAEVKLRTAEFLNELVACDELKDSNVLLVTHGFSMRALLNPLYENRDDFWQEHVPYNCETAIIEAKDGKMQLVDRGSIYYDVNLVSTYG